MNRVVVPELQTTTPRRSAGLGGWLVLVLAAGGLVGMWAGTQYLAHRLGYHHNLGPFLYQAPSALAPYIIAAAWACAAGGLILVARPRGRRCAIPLALAALLLFAIRLGPIYSPFQLLRWAHAYRDVPELTDIISGGVRMAAMAAVMSILGGLVLIRSRRQRAVSASFGSARWASGTALRGSEGLMIGRRIDDGELLRFNGEGHLITLAPTRSGKGVSAVIPNLLDYPGSVLVVDVKPENAAVTARRRRERGLALLGSPQRL